MLINGLQRTTLIDFPKKVACVVFLGGCNFRCPFCYSSEIVLPNKLKNQPQISEKEFFDFLESKKGLLEGVVVCGGEPTLQKELPEFIEKIKTMGFAVKLDTNGSNPAMLEYLIDKKLVDYVAMDIKASPLSYEKVTCAKVDINAIKTSAELLKEGKVAFEFRTTIVPGLFEDKEIKNIIDWIGGEKTDYFLQSFWPDKTLDPKFMSLKPFDDNKIKEIQEKFKPYFRICRVRGKV